MTRLVNRRAALLAALSIAATPLVSLGQGTVAVPVAPGDLARADALLRAGRVEAAEALYFREARRRPRDPAARLALGRYLASRGATRIGAVLIEEARFFGTNPAVAAVHLAPLYARLGDYKALALLPAAPLTGAERARAEWLAKNAPAVLGPDSLAIAFAPSEADSTSLLGTITIEVDGEALAGEIDPAVRGLVLDTSRARSAAVKVFTAAPAAVLAGSPGMPAVLLRGRLSGWTVTNLAVSLEPLGSSTRARIGLDFLGRFSPTVQPHDRRIVLRRSGRVTRSLPGEHVPLLLDPREPWLVWEGRPERLSAESVARRLRAGRWTLDSKRGEIVLQS